MCQVQTGWWPYFSMPDARAATQRGQWHSISGAIISGYRRHHAKWVYSNAAHTIRSSKVGRFIGAPGTVSDRSKDWAAGDQRDAGARH